MRLDLSYETGIPEEKAFRGGSAHSKFPLDPNSIAKLDADVSYFELLDVDDSWTTDSAPHH